MGIRARLSHRAHAEKGIVLPIHLPAFHSAPGQDVSTFALPRREGDSEPTESVIKMQPFGK